MVLPQESDGRELRGAPIWSGDQGNAGRREQRGEGAYRAYVTDEQRSDATWIRAFPPESNLFGALKRMTLD